MLQDLIHTAIQEIRIPEFLADRCVHSHSENAECRACVESCPEDAWVLDAEQLGIIPDRCDGCGLCVPACTEAAIKTDYSIFTGKTKKLMTGLIACDQSINTDSSQGIVPCLHTMGLREILSVYRQGCRFFLLRHADCNNCSRGTAHSIGARINQLNILLRQRKLPDIRYLQLSESQWLSFRNKVSEKDKTPVNRRNFLRKALADVVEHSLQTTDHEENCAFEFPAPGALLPSDHSDDQQFCYPVIDEQSCNACHACVRLCRHDAITLKQAPTMGYVINPDACTGCQLCVDSCDQNAIRINFWTTPQSLFIPLTQNSCRSCGNTYYSNITTDPDQTNSQCSICSATNHLTHLYQVLDD